METEKKTVGDTTDSKTDNKTTKSSAANDKKKSIQRVLFILGIVVCSMQLITGVVTGIYLLKLNILPFKYLCAVGGVFLLLTLLFYVLQKWTVSGIITKFLSIALTAFLIIVCVYMGYTYKKINSMVGIVTKVDNMQVYVLKEDVAESIADAKDYTFGILGTADRDNTDIFREEIENELGKKLDVIEYDSVSELMQGLYDREVGAVILNSAYVSFVAEDVSYGDFLDKVKSIGFKDIETEVVVEETEVPEEYLYSGDRVFTVYISGIDTYGSPNVTSRSDVNILLTANLDTRQVLMISTPRDFYVPLSISGGVRDKLTHAGIYGIDVSKDTLAMLYGVQVDDYVRINFTGFKEIIDELGGIEVYSEYDFSSGKYSFHEGYNRLNGEYALAFARCRYAFADGDRQRGKNQMAVIEAVIKKMATSDMLYNYTDVLDAISDSMITSMTYDEISELVKFQLNDMKGWDVVSYSVNGYDSSNTTYSAGSQMLYVMEPDDSTVEQAKEYLRQIYAGEKIVIEKQQ